MKVTLTSTYRSLLQEMNQRNESLSDLRLAAASGKKLNRPSDDPAAIRPVLSARTEIQGTERYLKTMDAALNNLQFADGQLDTAGNLLIRAKEIGIQANNGTLSAQERLTMAEEIAQLKDSMLGVANARMGGRYLFAGYEEMTRPFGGDPVSYSGDSATRKLEIGPGEQVPVNLPGSTVFLGDADGDGATDPGGTDVFAVLTDIEAALRANDPAAVGAQLGNLDAGLDQITRLRGQMGNTANRVESAREQMEDTQVDLQTILSRYEDADLLETITEMTQQEQALQAALNVTSRISKLSILDYL